MALTPAELMKPRYKIIADYPGNKGRFAIGEILIVSHSVEWCEKHRYKCAETAFYCPEPREENWNYLEDYPAIFQPMPWYAERKPEYMPEYVKYNHNGVIYHSDAKAGVCNNRIWIIGKGWILAEKLSPSDYEAYQNSKK